MRELNLRQLQPDDDVSDFRVGPEKYRPLEVFLVQAAKRFHKRNLARTYVLGADRRQIVAYLTLVCGEVELQAGKSPAAEHDKSYRYKSYPAVKIARLAVDERYRGKALGKMLVTLALGIAKDQVCPAVGCRFVTVDAKSDAVKFYERLGFSFLETEQNRQRSEPILFVDLYKAVPEASA